MEANGVNYYKGVLLCSRPNESPSIQKEKAFCARVTPHDSLGLVPTKKYDSLQVRKRHLPVLDNHKKWLKNFKEKIDIQKKEENQQKQRQVRKLQKIKEEGKRREEKSIENSVITPIEDKQSHKNTNNAVEATRMKKGKKPVWAKTDQQIQKEQDQQVDELIDFFDTAEVTDYLDDEEVKKMVEDLKKRIEVMKKSGEKQNEPNNENWKKKQAERIEEAKTKDIGQKDDDILSRISRQSGGSISSQKTAERVEELQNKKKQEKEWDKYTTSEQKSQASLDAQIAKNVADEVLRNYPALKHHSNQSIRKLLEKQAHEQIKS